jgi:hypothetical protein
MAVKREVWRELGIPCDVSWKNPCVRQALRIEDIKVLRGWEREIVGMDMVVDGGSRGVRVVNLMASRTKTWSSLIGRCFRGPVTRCHPL